MSTGLTARLAERAAMQRRRGWQRVGWGLAAVAVIVLGAWVVFGSPLFRLDGSQVEVKGMADTVDAASLEGVIAEHVGTPLTVLDTVSLRTELHQVRGVREVSIQRIWPRGLEVTVEARAAVVAVPQGSAFVLLDDTGAQVGSAEELPADLPEVSIPLDGSAPQLTAAVIAVVSALPADLASAVASIEAPTFDQITMHMRSGLTVVWGGPQDGALKAKVLQTMLANGLGEGVGTIDVSAPTAPITR